MEPLVPPELPIAGDFIVSNFGRLLGRPLSSSSESARERVLGRPIGSSDTVVSLVRRPKRRSRCVKYSSVIRLQRDRGLRYKAEIFRWLSRIASRVPSENKVKRRLTTTRGSTRVVLVEASLSEVLIAPVLALHYYVIYDMRRTLRNLRIFTGNKFMSCGSHDSFLCRSLYGGGSVRRRLLCQNVYRNLIESLASFKNARRKGRESCAQGLQR